LVRIAGLTEYSCLLVLYYLRDTPYSGCDDRGSRRLPFKNDPREPFGVRGQNEDIELVIQRRDLFVGDGTEKSGSAAERSFETRPVGTVACDDHVTISSSRCNSAGKVVKPLVRLDATYVSDSEVTIFHIND
jgi:hypothetical protein